MGSDSIIAAAGAIFLIGVVLESIWLHLRIANRIWSGNPEMYRHVRNTYIMTAVVDLLGMAAAAAAVSIFLLLLI